MTKLKQLTDDLSTYEDFGLELRVKEAQDRVVLRLHEFLGDQGNPDKLRAVLPDIGLLLFAEPLLRRGLIIEVANAVGKGLSVKDMILLGRILRDFAKSLSTEDVIGSTHNVIQSLTENNVSLVVRSIIQSHLRQWQIPDWQNMLFEFARLLISKLGGQQAIIRLISTWFFAVLGIIRKLIR